MSAEMVKARKRESGFVESFLVDEVRQNVSLHVVDGNQRNVQGQRQGFGKGTSHKKRTHQTGTLGKSDCGSCSFVIFALRSAASITELCFVDAHARRVRELPLRIDCESVG